MHLLVLFYDTLQAGYAHQLVHTLQTVHCCLDARSMSCMLQAHIVAYPFELINVTGRSPLLTYSPDLVSARYVQASHAPSPA